MLVLAALVISTPLGLMINDLHAQTTTVDAHDRAVSALTEQQRRDEFAKARDYNQRLFASGQTVMGEVTDPFAAARAGGSGDEPTIADRDEDYQSQLSLPVDGIMATIRYPRLGITLPVRHGTSAKVLADGAGHMYGTSVPVGGRNTHSVISAHSGMGSRIMFDKLSLRMGRVGDRFTITVLGRDLTYKVTSITVVQPNEFDELKVVPGKDMVTLLTCTPYGVNTQRILVTGERTANPASEDDKAPWDWTPWLLGGVIALVWLIVILVAARIVRRRR